MTYVSTLAPDIPIDEVDRIVSHARRRNPESQITGMLALEDRRICQVLEGPVDAVRTMFATIQSDRRHQGVTLLDEREIEQRRYAGWSMEKRAMVDVVMMAFAA